MIMMSMTDERYKAVTVYEYLGDAPIPGDPTFPVDITLFSPFGLFVFCLLFSHVLFLSLFLFCVV